MERPVKPPLGIIPKNIEYNSYLDKIEEHKALEQKLKQSGEIVTALTRKLLKLGILEGQR